ncbi:MAG: DedA family protein, partial [Aeromonas sobria]
MEQFYQLAHAFMNHDLNTLSDPKMAFMICGVILTFLVLENGFIPTAFLPGDSLLILTGVLIYQDVLPLGVIPLLIIATFVGTWLGYMQGR